MVKLANKQ